MLFVLTVSSQTSGVSDEEDQKPVRLPLKVAVELQPRSNYSWARVQSLAHNPRLRSDMLICMDTVFTVTLSAVPRASSLNPHAQCISTLCYDCLSRMVVELHRKVSSLIEYLKQKWTYHDQRIVSYKTLFNCCI